ncbi:MAG: hypothetical protein C4522_12455 [Desulfobacteraceae bacterium]|nr:MAG: hypothetical protein C4522_12455 [Desulfobacteraceae bacterium]
MLTPISFFTNQSNWNTKIIFPENTEFNGSSDLLETFCFRFLFLTSVCKIMLKNRPYPPMLRHTIKMAYNIKPL